MTERHAAKRPPDLHPIEASALHARRERVFLVLAGLFLGSLTMLNILGITRFIDLSFEFAGLHVPMWVAIGVLPYPITFLCTDFISELYGEKRANGVVWTGLLLNLWVALILFVGGAAPGGEPLDPTTGELVKDAAGRLPIFFEVKELAFGAMFASMVAYLVAQLVDVRLFHFWKKRTGGKHLWLRNNGSTLVSQLVDSTAVILVTAWVARESLPDQPLLTLILSGYVFKMVIAIIDTGPFYLGVRFLRGYLQIDPNAELSASSVDTKNTRDNKGGGVR